MRNMQIGHRPKKEEMEAFSPLMIFWLQKYRVFKQSSHLTKLHLTYYTLFEILIFCPKIQLWFPEKVVDFFLGEKLVKMLWFWTF